MVLFAACCVAIAMLPLAILFDFFRGIARRAEERALLAHTGLVPDPSARRLEGVREHLPMRVSIDESRPVPGKSGGEAESHTGTLIELPAPGPDLMVCLKSLSDAIVGPLPAWPRLALRDPAFEARYEAFCVDAAVDPARLVPPSLRPALFALGLMWMRRKDGSLEIFLANVKLDQVEAAIAVAIAIARVSGLEPYRGQGPARVEPVFVPTSARPEPIVVYPPLVVSTGIALIAALPAGLLLGLVPAVQEQLGSIACDPGFRVVTVRTPLPMENGEAVGIVCLSGSASRPAHDALLYGGACASLVMAPILGIGLLFAVVRCVRILSLRRPRA